MPLVDTVVECPVFDSFRVQQVAGIFDVPLAKTSRERFTAEVPSLDEPWQIGVIVGPSGSGKSTIARAAFGDCLYQGSHWPADRAVVDCFGDLPIKQVLHVLSSVGFSSPPAWIRPYTVLSNGEKFRCDLAKALLVISWHGFSTHANGDQSEVSVAGEADLNSGPLASVTNRCHDGAIVFDEFTSVVDRTVAKIGSASVSKAIRSGRIARRFVAVTCHYDVVPWLEPDWVLDMADRKLSRGLLRRPPIQFEIHRATTAAWELFKRHHYLSTELHRSATCFVGTVDGAPAAFTAVLFFPHPLRPGWREHRTVCLPDFQGVGIGNAMSEFVASLFRATGKPYYSTTSHPAMIRHRSRSPLWRVTRPPQTMSTTHRCPGLAAKGSAGRLTAGFEYVGKTRESVARQFGLRVAPVRVVIAPQRRAADRS